jgi:hypothetical protein
MNSLLVDLIAAQAAGTGNPAVGELLARMRSSSNGEANGQNVRELIAQLGQGNPTVALLAKYLADRQEAQRQQAAAIPMQSIKEVVEAVDRPGDHMPDAQASLDPMQELRHQVTSMFAELQEHRERSDRLAWALGACCLCWGRDPDCRNCRGRGRPGFSMPDEKLFAEFVMPAVRMLRARTTGNGGSSPRIQPGTSGPGARPDQSPN